MLHFLLGGFGIMLGYSFSPWAGWVFGGLYLAFAFVEMYLVMPMTVCPRCVYRRIPNSRCINGLNIVSRRLAPEGKVSDFGKRAEGLLCANNRYMASLGIPILAVIPALIVNFSVLLFRLLGRPDPRRAHSGNPGATNVYRQAGPVWAAAVLRLDVGRAMAVAYAARRLFAPPLVPWMAFGLLLGNRYPFLHGFRGGKGVANYLGFTLLAAPAWTLAGVVAWAAAYARWRTPFWASFSMVAFLALGQGWVFGPSPAALLGVGLSTALVVAAHRENLRGWLAQRRG